MCSSEEVRVNSIEAGVFVDKCKGSQGSHRLKTLIILPPPVPCSDEWTVNEAVISSSAHITRYKLVCWARKNCPFLTFQSDFPCGDQQKEKALFLTGVRCPFKAPAALVSLFAKGLVELHYLWLLLGTPLAPPAVPMERELLAFTGNSEGTKSSQKVMVSLNFQQRQLYRESFWSNRFSPL